MHYVGFCNSDGFISGKVFELVNIPLKTNMVPMHTSQGPLKLSGVERGRGRTTPGDTIRRGDTKRGKIILWGK